MSGGASNGLGAFTGWGPPNFPSGIGSIYTDGSGTVWIYDGSNWVCQGRSWNTVSPVSPNTSVTSQMWQAQIRHQQLMAMQNAQLSAMNVNNATLHKLTRPDPKAPDTLGWRAWRWNHENKCLQSPVQHTLWHSAVLNAESWSKHDAVRNSEGIHALLVRKHWKLIGWQEGYVNDSLLVHGIVERFGRYVLGTEGWRAEQVKILELMAPSTEIGLQLEQKYPGVIIHYPDQEEDEEWTLEKSSRSAKGKRSLLPNPSANPSTSPVSPSAVPLLPALDQPPLPSAKKKRSRLDPMVVFALAFAGAAVLSLFAGFIIARLGG